MPFEIVRNDITNMRVDAIVNTANPRPIVGPGVDAAIHEKAGPELLAARQKIGPIPRGHGAVTPAFRLQAKFVIHTVGPVWEGGGQGEERLLRDCYDSALKLALQQGCASIAFPLISTGNCGFPKDKALQIAISAFSAFLLEHEMQIYLVVFDQSSYRLSEKLFQGVASYIDEHYVDAACSPVPIRNDRRRRDRELCQKSMALPCSSQQSLESFLQKKDAGFVETLLELIQKRGLKNSTVYKRANISKQHFSKLVNDPRAAITKPVAVALALALELDLAETRDLIGRAGYTLTNGSYFDLIIRYHIENRKFNVVEINVALYEFDQPLLGSV